VEEGQLESIISEVEASRGPALVLWLQVRWRRVSWSSSSVRWRPAEAQFRWRMVSWILSSLS
jgi:hypothetical protein